MYKSPWKCARTCGGGWASDWTNVSCAFRARRPAPSELISVTLFAPSILPCVDSGDMGCQQQKAPARIIPIQIHPRPTRESGPDRQPMRCASDCSIRLPDYSFPHCTVERGGHEHPTRWGSDEKRTNGAAPGSVREIARQRNPCHRSPIPRKRRPHIFRATRWTRIESARPRYEATQLLGDFWASPRNGAVSQQGV